MNATNPMLHAWQASVTHVDAPSITDVRAAASRFERRVGRRNMVEYAASALVVLAFGAFALFPPFPAPAMRIGAMLIVIATVFVAWQIHRRASARPLPPGLPVLAHHRAELVRQRDALASVATWYLLPFLPGMLLVLFGPVIDAGPQLLRQMGWEQVPVLAAPPIIFLAIWLLNRRGARQLQAMIDELDILENDA